MLLRLVLRQSLSSSLTVMVVRVIVLEGLFMVETLLSTLTLEEEAEVEASCHFHLSLPRIPVPSEGVLLSPVAVVENRGPLEGETPNFL